MKKKLRIAVAIPTFYPYVGGAETQTLAQCECLVERGYDVRVITFHHKHEWATQEIVEGVRVERVAGRFLGKRAGKSRLWQKAMYFFAILVMGWYVWRKRHSFDVLNVCQCSLHVLPIALACWLAHKPMTVLIIGTGRDEKGQNTATPMLEAGPLDPEMPWLRLDRWLKDQGRTKVYGDLHSIEVASPLAMAATRFLLLKNRAIMIGLSTHTRTYLQAYRFDLPGTCIIPNGVDLSRYTKQDIALDNQQHLQTVVCVAKMRYEKGIDVLLQAWHLVHKEIPEAKLILVGNGPLQQPLEKLAEELGIRDSVDFAGLHSDVPAQLHRGAINILPSRWEGMPNALLEAMACGSASIATRVSGSEDIIQHGVNGLLVPAKDYVAMSKALLTLLGDPALVQRYSQAGRATIEQNYTLDAVVDRYLEVFYALSGCQEDMDSVTVTAHSENCSIVP